MARSLGRLPSREREGVLMLLTRLPAEQKARAVDALANCGLNYSEELDQLRGVRAELGQWQPPEAELGFRVVREPAPVAP